MAFVERMVIEVTQGDGARAPDPRGPVPGVRVRRGDGALRVGQAGHPVRDGAGRPRARADRRRRRARERLPRVRRDARRRAAGSRRSPRPGMGGVTRREIDELTELAKRFGAKGLVHLAVAGGRRAPRPDREVPLARDAGARSVERRRRRRGRPDPRRGRRGARSPNDVLGRLRVELGGRLGLADPDELAYCWVHRFPMYQWDAEGGRWDATHNPFSGVVPEDEVAAHDDLGRASTTARPATPPAGPARCSTTSRSTAGSWAAARCGSGTRDLLARSFNLQGYTLEQMQERFGAMLEAFEYGAPPHGGIALGIDRWAALLADQTNIREVMAFPKTQSGSDLDARGAVRARGEAVRGARACGSSASPSGADRGRAAASGALTADDDAGVRGVGGAGAGRRRARPRRRPRRRLPRPVRAVATPSKAAVAELDGDLVGWSSPEVKALVVEPAYRRRGIGRAPGRRRRCDRTRRGRDEPDPRRAARATPRGTRSCEATGFASTRTLWDLELPTDVAVAAPALARGLRGPPDRPRRRDLDDVGRRCSTRRSPTHPTPLQTGPRGRLAGLADPRRRATRTRSSWPRSDGRLVGFCATEPRRLPEGGVEPHAEIWTIGVLPAAAGPRARARQLLRARASRTCAALGVETVTAVGQRPEPGGARPVRGGGVRAGRDPRPLGAARRPRRREPARPVRGAGRGPPRSSAPSRSRSPGSSTAASDVSPVDRRVLALPSTGCRCSSCVAASERRRSGPMTRRAIGLSRRRRHLLRARPDRLPLRRRRDRRGPRRPCSRTSRSSSSRSSRGWRSGSGRGARCRRDPGDARRGRADLGGRRERGVRRRPARSASRSGLFTAAVVRRVPARDPARRAPTGGPRGPSRSRPPSPRVCALVFGARRRRHRPRARRCRPHAYLLALGVLSQSVGYLAIQASLPRLPAVITSVLLFVQPVTTMLLGAVLLGELPSPCAARRGRARDRRDGARDRAPCGASGRGRRLPANG